MQDYYRPEAVSPSDYGAPIEQATAEAMAQKYLLPRLKDPDSAKFNCGQINRGSERDALIYGGKVWSGYVLFCAVNAKNSYGGFTGNQPFTFVFHDGYLVRVYQAQGTPID